MMGLLARLFRVIRGDRVALELLREMDIGEGTRLSIANLDGMFPHLIHVGENCVIAPTAMLLSHDASCYLFGGKYRIAPVFIGDNVFIGYGAIVMPGVRIGSNVVIGAGSVVTKDVPSDSVAAGVPARVIASHSQYLAKCKAEQMFTPPYAGKAPSQVTEKDVAEFRRAVYQAFQKTGSMHAQA